MSHWVTITSSSPLAPEPRPPDWVQTGTYSWSGPGAMTTPAAWTDE